jgi:copper chaperone
VTGTELTISGMTCDHCIRAVDDALRKVPGVTHADVRIGSASVRFDETRTSTAVLTAAVRAAGYAVSGFRKASLPAAPA